MEKFLKFMGIENGGDAAVAGFFIFLVCIMTLCATIFVVTETFRYLF